MAIIASGVPRYYPDLQEGEDDKDADKETVETDWSNSTSIKSRFDVRHFEKACQVIRALRNPHKKLMRPTFNSDDERILTYELTVSILKYSSFLNQALEASEFYKRNSMYKRNSNEDVLVVLYDLFERDFQVHQDDPPLNERFSILRQAILGIRTKIMAHLARLRIQHQATTVNHLLPENLRHQKHIDQNPIYAWVNLRKGKLTAVLTALNESGFKRSEFEDDILIQEDCYYVDTVHNDLIRFHSSRKDTIFSSALVQDGILIVQDKSACIPVYTLVDALFYRENMNRNQKLNGSLFSSTHEITACLRGTYLGVPISMPPPEDWYENILETGKKESRADSVIVTHGGSGRSVAHLACLLQESVPKWLSRNTEMSSRDDLVTALSNKFFQRPPLNVIAFGVPPNKLDEISRFLRKHMLLGNVKLCSEDFLSVSPKDPKIKNACAILVNPPSSGSALKDPVSYVCTEGGDEDVLLHLSKFVHTQTDPDAAQDYTSSQIKFLRHALNFPQARLILYTTCSLLTVENEDVVEAAMQEFHQEYMEHKLRIFADILNDKKSIRFYRDIHLELINVGEVLDAYSKPMFKGPFLEMPPSSASSGCFLALIHRKETLITIEKHKGHTGSQPHTATAGQEDELGSTGRNSMELAGTGSSNSAGKSGSAFLNTWFQNALLHSDSRHSTASSVRSSRSAGAGTEARRSKKHSMTKRAIVQRVSVPTHASMAKQTPKWTAENKDGSVISRGRGSRVSHDRSHIYSSRGAHDHQIRCGCHICARHARKFPDYHPK